MVYVLLEECNVIAILWINGEVGVLVDVEGRLIGTFDLRCGDKVSNCVQCGPDMAGCSVDGFANLILQLLDKFSW